ncbi:MAG: hypothetical protein BRC48_00435 [Cyanobacteria bacterium QS_9_48_30]|nr:MAG: hypothetical protein BRC48_00435 [Cyanobacteria bacterium QS_9_48_30]
MIDTSFIVNVWLLSGEQYCIIFQLGKQLKATSKAGKDGIVTPRTWEISFKKQIFNPNISLAYQSKVNSIRGK